MSQCAINAGRKVRNSEEEYSIYDNSKRMKRIIRRILLSFGVLFCLCFFVSRFFYVEQKMHIVEVELGSDIERNIETYLDGNKWALQFARAKFPIVSRTTPGSYTISIDYLFTTYDYEVYVKDTKAPIVKLNTDNYVLETGKIYTPYYFVESIDDRSPVSLSYINVDEDANVCVDDNGLLVSKSGTCNVVLKAEDSCGNYSTYFIGAVVDTAPQISLLYDEIYISTGCTPDFLSNAEAMDDMDGCTYVSVDTPEDVFSVEGNHYIQYYATDSLGLTTSKKCLVHTYNPLKLQDMCNTGELNPNEGNIYGIMNRYDCGYCVDQDINTAIEKTKNAIVRIQYDYSHYRVNGSGYILKIDDDQIIVCTNKHVIDNKNVVNIYFYDGSVVQGTVLAKQSEPDIAFVGINTADVAFDTKKELKTVHINKSYYDSLSNSPEFDMGVYSIYENGQPWWEKTGKIVRKSGLLAKHFDGYDYPVTEVSVKLTHGVSGSAIIDAHGNLICMATFMWNHNGKWENYGVSLDEILDFYEETFGSRLEYY